MGPNPSVSQENKEESIQSFLQKVSFVMEGKNAFFGSFKIYKMQQKPYEYIMRKDYSALVGDQTLAKRKQQYERAPKHKNIISFDYVSLRTIQQRCGKHLQLSLFCRYYFFSLEEAILKKIKKQIRFPQQQVLYIAKTLISVYEVLSQHFGGNCGIFRASTMFLTPQGFLKAYPWINDWKQQSIQQNNSMGSSRKFFTFATEHEVSLDLDREKRDFSAKESVRDDIHDIGVILLSVICLAKQSDYRTPQGNIKQDIVKFVLNSYNEPDNKSLVLFKPILKGIFQRSWTIQTLSAQLSDLQSKYHFKNPARIKIINPQNQDSQITINGQNFQKQRESRLKMVPKKQLVPGRIRCYSARPSNQDI